VCFPHSAVLLQVASAVKNISTKFYFVAACCAARATDYELEIYVTVNLIFTGRTPCAEYLNAT
jgi:hypothetical protein